MSAGGVRKSTDDYGRWLVASALFTNRPESELPTDAMIERQAAGYGE
jgi:hypothetical protein